MAKLVLSDSRRLADLDDIELEGRRLAFLKAGDDQSHVAIVVLCVRAVPVIELICRERGAARGIGTDQTLLAIEDAAARLMLRLHRVVPLPPVGALAAQFAAICIDAQPLGRTNRHQLAAGRACLSLVPDLGRPWKLR